MWYTQDSLYTLLVEVLIHTTTMENSPLVSNKLDMSKHSWCISTEMHTYVLQNTGSRMFTAL